MYIEWPMANSVVRGGVMIKKWENFGGKKTQKCLIFKFGHLKTHGVSIFQKCLNYKLLSDPIPKKKTLNLTFFNVNMPK